jgi:hypothetical protein
MKTTPAIKHAKENEHGDDQGRVDGAGARLLEHLHQERRNAGDDTRHDDQ